MTIKIANASGFWGDQIDAALTLLKSTPDLDYLTFDYLAELSMSILALQREKDPSMGYAKDFLESFKALSPLLEKSKVKLITNAGGLNPLALATELKKLVDDKHKIAVVTGDNVLDQLIKNPQNLLFANLETKESLEEVKEQLVTANAYLGAESINSALQMGADVVITGRVADPSLTVACALHHFGWSLSDYDKIAQATLAGHLIECGTQVTGGLSENWLELQELAKIGFPICEMGEDGNFVITKSRGSGGELSIRTVKEQMIYEIKDPEAVQTPDVLANFLGVTLEETGPDRVMIKGAKGQAAPPTLKVSCAIKQGYRSEATLALFGDNLVEKGKKIGEVILERIKRASLTIDRSDVSVVGYDAVTPLEPSDLPIYEALVRIAVASSDKEAVLRFSKEVAPLITSGPAGVSGYTGGRSPVREMFLFWPCLISRRDLVVDVTILKV